MDMLDKPMGGTELMYEELMKRLPQEYKDKFSIFNYAAYADTAKPTIYWNQLSYDQQAVQFLTASENTPPADQTGNGVGGAVG
jgi:putative NADPH-quinone reductase